MRPRIVLHIGRNKAGSTTIQDFCLQEQRTLASQGVTYALFGHLSHSRVDTPGFATFEGLREHALAYPRSTLLVSNEFMFGWPDEFTRAAARVLADCDVQILAYIRSYDEWIVSAYAEETRKGMNMRDIDGYERWMMPRISAWKYLCSWAEHFGWSATRVRTLSPESLYGGDLISDFCSALTVEAPASVPIRRNASPHWLELELARCLCVRNGEVEWAGVSPLELEPLLAELRPLLLQVGQERYLSIEAQRRLIDLYNDDLGRMEAASGDRLPRTAQPSGSDRIAAPRFADAPRGVLAAFFKRTSEAAFRASHPEAAARSVRLAREMGHVQSP